jgi:tripartite ATP-independent transporter DctP family solute receptor
MDRRDFLTMGLIGAAVAGFRVGAPNIARAAEPLRLRFAHFAKLDHPAHIAAQHFADQVTNRTGGGIKIEIFPDNSRGSPPEQAVQIKAGTIDMGLPTQGQLDKFDSAFGAVLLPFIFRNSEHAFRILDGPGMRWLAPLAEKQGFILLRNWDYGFRNITNSLRPIQTPADVKGLRLRTPHEIQIQAAMEALGAEVQTIALPEVYQALAQKTVDGQENPIAVIYANKFYEVQKHLTLTRHAYNCMIHTVSAASWSKLSLAQQIIFREESISAGNLMRKLVAEAEAGQIAKLAAAGLQITTPDTSLFRPKMDAAYKRIAAYIGEVNVKTFLRLVLLDLQSQIQ